MSTATSPAPAGQGAEDHGDGALSHRAIVLILSGLMAGMFLAALDQTIVSTSIRTIADDLHGLSIQAWVTTAYLITATISTPLYGKLSDIYGRRPFFLTAITIFVVGSLMSGFATTMYQLAGFRAIQGLGAGGLFSLALATIGDIVPPRQRAKYQGYFLAVFGTSSVLGPVVGGFFAGQSSLLGITGWRWVFLINVPIGLAAFTIVARTLHIPHTRVPRRLDFGGAVALVVALVPLLLIAEQGRTWGWGSGRALACYAIGIVGIIAFIAVENAMKDDALLPLRLFGGRTFSIASVLNLIIGMGMFGILASLPLYMQIVKGKSPTASGLLLLPLVLGIMSGSILSGQVISRTGRYKMFPIMGSVLLVTGALLLSRVDLDSSFFYVDLGALIFGIGLGFNMQPLILAIQNAVPAKDMGVATSSATFFRQMGGTLGTAVFLSVLFSTLPDRIGSALTAGASDPDFTRALADPAVAANPVNQQILQLLKGGGTIPSSALNDSSFLSNVDSRLARPFLEGFASSIDTVFVLGAMVLAIAFVVVLFLPEERLRDQSGLQSRMAGEKAESAEKAESVERADGVTSPAEPPLVAAAEAASVQGVLRPEDDASTPDHDTSPAGAAEPGASTGLDHHRR